MNWRWPRSKTTAGEAIGVGIAMLFGVAALGIGLVLLIPYAK